MSTQIDPDLLPDDLADPSVAAKKGAVPVVRTPAQKAATTRAAKKAQADALAKADAVRLAQIVNLHLAGLSLGEIGAQIGASAEEVDRLLATDAARYVRNQPALRAYVRNWVSERFTKMIEANWAAASDPNDSAKLENQDRVIRMLDRMARLHGADVPVQSEVKVDAAPEAVERLVHALASQQGLAYDDTVFDVIEAEVVEAEHRTQVSGNAAEQAQEGDPDEGF